MSDKIELFLPDALNSIHLFIDKMLMSTDFVSIDK